ncbi:MAG: NADH-quinone oxidoreductase subunit A [Planctomycetes bacterium]|nr:NADH-quinone oxidoreductase subunit A [Planctomycetota bacterium]
MLFDFASVLVFIILGLLFIFFVLLFSWVVSPRNPDKDKASTYECGERPLGPAWMKFNIRFYVIALIFIIFDVEILLLFPWAVVFQKLPKGVALVEVLIFIGLLLVGLAYLWNKGDLEWVKTVDKDK